MKAVAVDEDKRQPIITTALCFFQAAALRTFHISDDPRHFDITDITQTGYCFIFVNSSFG